MKILLLAKEKPREPQHNTKQTLEILCLFICYLKIYRGNWSKYIILTKKLQTVKILPVHSKHVGSSMWEILILPCGHFTSPYGSISKSRELGSWLIIRRALVRPYVNVLVLVMKPLLSYHTAVMVLWVIQAGSLCSSSGISGSCAGWVLIYPDQVQGRIKEEAHVTYSWDHISLLCFTATDKNFFVIMCNNSVELKY